MAATETFLENSDLDREDQTRKSLFDDAVVDRNRDRPLSLVVPRDVFPQRKNGRPDQNARFDLRLFRCVLVFDQWVPSGFLLEELGEGIPNPSPHTHEGPGEDSGDYDQTAILLTELVRQRAREWANEYCGSTGVEDLREFLLRVAELLESSEFDFGCSLPFGTRLGDRVDPARKLITGIYSIRLDQIVRDQDALVLSEWLAGVDLRGESLFYGEEEFFREALASLEAIRDRQGSVDPPQHGERPARATRTLLFHGSVEALILKLRQKFLGEGPSRALPRQLTGEAANLSTAVSDSDAALTSAADIEPPRIGPIGHEKRLEAPTTALLERDLTEKRLDSSASAL